MVIAGDPIRTVAPTALPLTLDEIKAQVRVDDDTEDALLMGYLRAAVEEVETYTGLGLITQTVEQRFSAFHSTMILRRRPVQSVTRIEYLDGSDDLQTLAASSYRVAGLGSARSPAVVRLGSGQSWPSTYDDAEAVRVTYQVGFGDDETDVPELIRQALLLITSTWYAFRENVVTGSSVAEMPFASRCLLHDWRPLAVA